MSPSLARRRPVTTGSHTGKCANFVGARKTGLHWPGHSDCDAPFSLTNHTFDFLGREWADEIDFVICDYLVHSSFPRAGFETYLLHRDWG